MGYPYLKSSNLLSFLFADIKPNPESSAVSEAIAAATPISPNIIIDSNKPITPNIINTRAIIFKSTRPY